MDQEILSSLHSIRVLLYVFVAIAAIQACLVAIRIVLVIRNDLRGTTEKVFQLMADDYWAENKIGDLITLCEQKLAQRPNDAYALWYLARARYIQKNHREAQDLLDKLSNIEPSWNRSHIHPMLEAISEAKRVASAVAPSSLNL
ncbi:MAG: hypothetical protein ABL904_04190 [Hyphomicrobiaceae bacterium]